MGLFDLLKKKTTFAPNPNKTEYENYLDFLASGGTAEDWKRLKRINNIRFAEDDTIRFEQYQKEVSKVANCYYSTMQQIEKEWSVLYNLQEYAGNKADLFEKACKNNIELYKKMHEIDLKYGEKTATNIPAYRRLAMLYEKQGFYEKSVSVCKEAISLGMDERSRMIRMIKKAGRTATPEELELLESNIH